MDASVPRIFDRALARRHLARARRAGHADFLVARAAGELAERLATVSRRFPLALDLGTPSLAAAQALQASGQVDRVVRLAPGLADLVSGAGIATLVGDEEALPVAPASLDLVVSCLTLQGVNDLPGVLAQVRRALRPDGLLLACLFGGETLHELRAAFAAAEAELEGGASPRVAPFADVRAIGGLLQRAGFALPVTDVDVVTVRYPNALALMAELRAMGLANAMTERRRTPLRRATLFRAAALYAERFSDPDGRVRARFETVWLSGWAPHASQQRPLRPGSAKVRLADALGVPERRVGGQRS